MICESFWQESFRSGEIIEVVICKGYRAILVKGASTQSNFQYPYRAFFFQQGYLSPSLILSLEISLRSDTCALGAHTQTEHVNYGSADPNMTFGDFKSWALSTAELNYSKKMRFQEATDAGNER